MKPRLLDLFCGAGGCSVGYHRAGFDVIGVDINPQPRYPLEFHQADAMTYSLEGFDVIHASPPCQAYSVTKNLKHNKIHPELIQPIRNKLIQSKKIYVIENVIGSPLINPIMLCGSSFGIRVRRHRLFESNKFLFGSLCQHSWQNDSPIWTIRQHQKTRICYVFGHQETGQSVEDWKKAMDIDWMIGDELSQAIPPAYTEFIGKQLMRYFDIPPEVK